MLTCIDASRACSDAQAGCLWCCWWGCQVLHLIHVQLRLRKLKFWKQVTADCTRHCAKMHFVRFFVIRFILGSFRCLDVLTEQQKHHVSIINCCVPCISMMSLKASGTCIDLLAHTSGNDWHLLSKHVTHKASFCNWDLPFIQWFYWYILPSCHSI